MNSVVRIKFAHDAPLKERYVPGPDGVCAKVLQACPSFSLKRDAIRGVLNKLRGGKTPEDIMRSYGAYKGTSCAVRTPELIAKVDVALRGDPNSLTDSQRILAKKFKVPEGVISRIIKGNLKKEVYEKVKTSADKEATRQRRVDAAEKYLRGWRINNGARKVFGTPMRAGLIRQVTVLTRNTEDRMLTQD